MCILFKGMALLIFNGLLVTVDIDTTNLFPWKKQIPRLVFSFSNRSICIFQIKDIFCLLLLPPVLWQCWGAGKEGQRTKWKSQSILQPAVEFGHKNISVFCLLALSIPFDACACTCAVRSCFWWRKTSFQRVLSSPKCHNLLSKTQRN